MCLDNLIKAEYRLYIDRYNAYIDSNQSDEVAEILAVESERILKRLFTLKYGVDPADDISGWLAFWGSLAGK